MPSLNTKLASTPNTSSNYVLKATSSTTIGNSLIYDNGVSVGIGTTNPGMPLQVSTTSTVGIATYIEQNGTGNGLQVTTSGTAGTSFIFKATSAGVDRFWIGDTGNVGIGTTSPSSALEVKTSTATNSIRLGVVADNTTYNLISLNGVNTEGNYIGIAGGGGTDRSIYYQSGNGGNHLFRTGDGIAFTERMRITSSGNVGIGTSSPSQLLHLNKVAAAVGLAYSSSDVAKAYIGMSYNANEYINNSSQYDLNFRSQGYNLNFSTNSGDSAAMRITSGGQVGIGVVPANWVSTWKVLQSANAAISGPPDKNGIVTANCYYDGSWRYITSATATCLELNQGTGDLRIFTSAAGTAGNPISWSNGPYVANGGNSWTNGSSDVRKKKNFETSQGLAEVLQIEAVKYHFKWEKDTAPKRLGFKAQNLQLIIPEMVMETGEIAEDGSSYLTITPDYILPVLVKAIQEQQSIIDGLNQRLNALENK